jgi:hypothetical protein
MKKPAVILSLGLLILVALVLFVTRPSPASAKLSQAEFTAMLQSNRLAKVRVYYPAKPGQVDGVPAMLTDVRGTFYQTDAAGLILETQGVPTEAAFIAKVRLTPELERKMLSITNVSIIELNPFLQKAGLWLSRSK